MGSTTTDFMVGGEASVRDQLANQNWNQAISVRMFLLDNDVTSTASFPEKKKKQQSEASSFRKLNLLFHD